ncbi:TetR/AcrR family transcriptional regulator [Mycolicibacterium fortuitum]|jgi:AcrR family transcriptional regulator|uniref:Helix-turn-helix domain-containing protein n=2 Tax=Mycolicibacterium fortuitum TaxID=1766 RepID=A0AAE4VFK8_MYCFO|nr:TetR/AcrR family transcriptional regulator [Mycolicibacterium fortuitum]MCA4726309.1 helix-turn-helix transcriptional regulator [Mycolicibacterium fortuitum]MCV7140984.1 helix-turn-helix transcriptional regulator [Mycolicibacterium fortuitum]MDV7192789.1 helix-turn-helix domain-containing protein [Mycolicibacterium fortuitum]MDV7205683.1 helix-turn-helix domain-containing protein [Mycolicibacterium fortuitum]MDV7229317.1 helix-turn-helix domain-containing protein [Mycolicibacterium fortuitu
MRADAARNRARVLEVAYETFAADGLAVPIDEIARRAGVGAGTVYRHFPTKEALFQAVIAERIRGVVEEGRTLLADADPADALFAFLRSMVLQWGAADRGLVDALAGSGIDVETLVPDAEDEYFAVLGDLLAAAQRAGTARGDVTVADVKALLVGCQAMQSYNADVAERVTSVVFDGLRAEGQR